MTTYSFEPIERPELFFGLVGTVGVDTRRVVRELEKALAAVQYKSSHIKLSDSLPRLFGVGGDISHESDDARVNALMTRGNDFREAMQQGDAVAIIGGIDRVRRVREELNETSSDDDSKSGEKIAIPSRAYIFDSLKHKDEISTLRQVYGKQFFLVSIYSPRQTRKEALAEKIARSRGKSHIPEFYEQAEQLITRDYDEPNAAFGQNVEEAFPLADLFIEDSSSKVMERHIQRFIEIVFGNSFHTPTKDEFGMFLAKSASLRSSDLSRQVGAAILDDDGCNLSLGCNDVPKAGGGQYWPNDIPDGRDWQIGYDTNARMKENMWAELLTLLQDQHILIDEDTSPFELAKKLLYGNDKTQTGQIRVSNVIEFGRIVHAEMASITDAARRGISIEGKNLYCTTFPCHMCARHIVSSGIKRVIFIEP